MLAGSTVRAESSPSLANHSYSNLRPNLIDRGDIAPNAQGELVFTRDTAFNSPSAAAVAVLGRSANGRTTWKVAGSDTDYGEWADGHPSVPKPAFTDVEPLEATWKPFFHELAVKLLDFETSQPELIEVLRAAGIAINHDEGEPLDQIDPFTFFSLILKHTSDVTALPLFAKVGASLGLTSPAPTNLVGVPWSNPMNAWFFAYRSVRQPEDGPTLWRLAQQAVAGELDAQTFAEALAIRQVALPKLTQGLFWLNPERFLTLNGVNVPYLQERGIRRAGQVQTLAEYESVMQAAAQINPDFAALSNSAWLISQQGAQTARLSENGAFPFAQFREEALRYSTDKVKGNLVLDKKYAPLLLEIMGGDWKALSPARSPYSGREQVAVKVALGGGVKADGASFGRALLFGELGGFEYVSFPAGLTLEVGLPDGKGDGPRRALADAQLRSVLLSALTVPLPTSSPATLTLNTDFGALKLLPLQEDQAEEVEGTLDRYAQGFSKSRRLRVGVSLAPQELEGENFPALLEAVLSYLDDLTGVLERLERTPDVVPDDQDTIQVPGQVEARPLAGFTPAPGVPLNQILYGPPGTGKTYRAIDDALVILDPATLKDYPGPTGRAARKERYDQLVQEGRISFVTFHQSFGYEDFIEGIKPVMQNGQLSYELQDGVFLAAVRAAGGDLSTLKSAPTLQEPTVQVRPDAQVWRIYIDGTTPISQLRDRSIMRGEIRVGSWGGAVQDLTGKPYDSLSEQKILFRDGIRIGDLILLATGANRIGGIGVVSGEYSFNPSEPLFATDYAHARSVRWLATDLSLSAQDVTGKTFSQQTIQRVKGVTPAQILALLPHALSGATGQVLQAHVLIIDEINRGNIAKIFGELITLLESGKRAGMAEALTATLPLSRRPLSVPQSLYVLGTMNTADRSLTLLDAALRRRFSFRPVWPEPQVLPTLTFADNEALDLRKFLYAINERIERLLSREQVIGHAYLLGLPATLAGVASAVRERILPLLEEYFFEDWSKIREVLADESKELEHQFIHRSESGGEVRYRLNEAAFGAVEAFSGVYAGVAEKDFPFGA
ncbi:DUF4357 domain-containing protein [Deinococcus detaillensis]|uniref:DUF4357 domain-containing protein n=2 Tax=Deinococcus detaillensis TaxID=2592048 RepID=A0A553UPL1_9DEIO|nr:DUF4357 domain-containing protein [Deinococcus detaillensis]